MKNKNSYELNKEKARSLAIEWQASAVEKEYSYGELCYYQPLFRKLGRKYGLLKEFKENCIC